MEEKVVPIEIFHEIISHIKQGKQRPDIPRITNSLHRYEEFGKVTMAECEKQMAAATELGFIEKKFNKEKFTFQIPKEWECDTKKNSKPPLARKPRTSKSSTPKVSKRDNAPTTNESGGPILSGQVVQTKLKRKSIKSEALINSSIKEPPITPKQPDSTMASLKDKVISNQINDIMEDIVKADELLIEGESSHVNLQSSLPCSEKKSPTPVDTRPLLDITLEQIKECLEQINASTTGCRIGRIRRQMMSTMKDLKNIPADIKLLEISIRRSVNQAIKQGQLIRPKKDLIRFPSKLQPQEDGDQSIPPPPLDTSTTSTAAVTMETPDVESAVIDEENSVLSSPVENKVARKRRVSTCSPEKKKMELSVDTTFTPVKKLKRKKMAKPIPVCSFCLGDENLNKRTNLPEEMVACGDCGICGHPTCLQWPPELFSKVCTLRWQCLKCKQCSFCGQATINDEDILLCDGCDRGFHMRCCDPPLSKPPKGKWLCNLCFPPRGRPTRACIFEDELALLSSGGTSITPSSVHEAGSIDRHRHSTGSRSQDGLQDGLTAFFTPTDRRKSRVSKFSKFSQYDDFVITGLRKNVVHHNRPVGNKKTTTAVSMVAKNTKEKTSSHLAARKLVQKLLKKPAKLEEKRRPGRPRKVILPEESDTKVGVKSVKSAEKVVKHRKLKQPDSGKTLKQRVNKKKDITKTPSRKGHKKQKNILETSSSTTTGRFDTSEEVDPEDLLLQPPQLDQVDLDGSLDNVLASRLAVTEFDRQLFANIQEQVHKTIPSLADTTIVPDEVVSEQVPPPPPPAPVVSKVVGGVDVSVYARQMVEQGRFPPRIQLGRFTVDTWYSAPYPSEYARLNILYICEYCLKYIKSSAVYIRHMEKCSTHFPPGNEIYRRKHLSVWEVDGYTSKLYCQNLCLLAKLFLDHKTLYYDVEPFLFYVVTVCDETSCHLVGYFSKEKHSDKKYNLSCVMVLPPYQKHGYGRFLIDFSYLLSRVEGQAGSPEKPLSALGKLSYESYWRSKVVPYVADSLLHDKSKEDGGTPESSLEAAEGEEEAPSRGAQQQPTTLTIAGITKATGIEPNDVAATLQLLAATVKLSKEGKPLLMFDPDHLVSITAKLEQRSSSWIPVEESCLRWSPLIHPRDISDVELDARRDLSGIIDSEQVEDTLSKKSRKGSLASQSSPSPNGKRDLPESTKYQVSSTPTPSLITTETTQQNGRTARPRRVSTAIRTDCTIQKRRSSRSHKLINDSDIKENGTEDIAPAEADIPSRRSSRHSLPNGTNDSIKVEDVKPAPEENKMEVDDEVEVARGGPDDSTFFAVEEDSLDVVPDAFADVSSKFDTAAGEVDEDELKAALGSLMETGDMSPLLLEDEELAAGDISQETEPMLRDVDIDTLAAVGDASIADIERDEIVDNGEQLIETNKSGTISSDRIENPPSSLNLAADKSGESHETNNKSCEFPSDIRSLSSQEKESSSVITAEQMVAESLTQEEIVESNSKESDHISLQGAVNEEHSLNPNSQTKDVDLKEALTDSDNNFQTKSPDQNSTLNTACSESINTPINDFENISQVVFSSPPSQEKSPVEDSESVTNEISQEGSPKQDKELVGDLPADVQENPETNTFTKTVESAPGLENSSKGLLEDAKNILSNFQTDELLLDTKIPVESTKQSLQKTKSLSHPEQCSSEVGNSTTRPSSQPQESIHSSTTISDFPPAVCPPTQDSFNNKDITKSGDTFCCYRDNDMTAYQPVEGISSGLKTSSLSDKEASFPETVDDLLPDLDLSQDVRSDLLAKDLPALSCSSPFLSAPSGPISSSSAGSIDYQSGGQQHNLQHQQQLASPDITSSYHHQPQQYIPSAFPEPWSGHQYHQQHYQQSASLQYQPTNYNNNPMATNCYMPNYQPQQFNYNPLSYPMPYPGYGQAYPQQMTPQNSAYLPPNNAYYAGQQSTYSQPSGPYTVPAQPYPTSHNQHMYPQGSLMRH